MKKYSIILLATLWLTSCNDFLDRPQLTQMNDQNYWTSENNVRLFANGFYANYFVGYNSGFAWDYAPLMGYTFCDDFTSSGTQAPFEVQAPATRASTSESVSMLSTYWGPGWNFSWVRKANIFLDRINGMKGKYLNDEQYNHWSAVARFFRGYEYSRLVSVFGNVPYFDHAAGDTELNELYKDRDDRAVVMDKVYDDFAYALANLRLSDNSNSQYLNRYIAAGFISRFMLFEGTWQKYRQNNTTKANQYLTLAVQAGDLVIQSGKWSFTKDFRSLFSSDNLAGHPEVLMFRTYDAALTITHSIASYANTTEVQGSSGNLALIKSFICYDGQPYQSSGVANATKFDLTNLMATRDPRFEATFWNQPKAEASGTLLYSDKFIDRTGPTYYGKTYPAIYGSSTNTNDAPVMRLAEVVLNWVEAKAELATVGGAALIQSDLDKSINAIRNRPVEGLNGATRKTAPLSLAALPNDPARDSDVPALLWEIRRERRMEFVNEHTRLMDIKRWGKIQYMDGSKNPDILLGTWVDFNTAKFGTAQTSWLIPGNVGKLKVQYADGTVVTYNGSNAASMVGFYVPLNVQNRSAFTDRVYMAPIGMNEISQYQAAGYTLTQTTGW